jgi:hypothetical protein
MPPMNLLQNRLLSFKMALKALTIPCYTLVLLRKFAAEMVHEDACRVNLNQVSTKGGPG